MSQERIIEHNSEKPILNSQGYSDMKKIQFTPSPVSHHVKSLHYYFTHGLVVNDLRYVVKEYSVRESKLYAVITSDEQNYYEIYISNLEEDLLDRIKDEIDKLGENDNNLSKRITILEEDRVRHSVDNDNQTLTLSPLRELSISNGNTVKLPNDHQELKLSGRNLSISDGNTVTLPEDSDTIYNDSELRSRVTELEHRTDNFVSNIGVSKKENKITLTYTYVDGSSKSVEFEDADTKYLSYDDSSLKARIKLLEDKQDLDNQTLSYDNTNNELSISRGNSVRIPMVAQKLSISGNVISLTDGGSVTIPSSNMIRICTVDIEGSPDKGTTSTVRTSDIINKDDIRVNDVVQDFSVHNGIAEEGYWRVTSVNGETLNLEAIGKRSFPYFDDTGLSSRINALSGRLDSVGSGILRISSQDIPGGNVGTTATISISSIYNSDGIKVGDIVEDFYQSVEGFDYGYWKITNISGQNATVTLIGSRSISKGSRNTDNQQLSLNDRQLSISGGNSVTLPNDKQTLAYNGKEMSISGGNTVPIETAYNILEEPHGKGLVGRYNNNTKLNYWISQPYLFFGRKTLRELGFNVGDKLNFNLFGVFSVFTGFPANAQIRVEFYITDGLGVNSITYIAPLKPVSNLVNHSDYEHQINVSENILDCNSICIRVDGFGETDHRLGFRHMQMYGGNYIVNKKLPYSMETFNDEINYLPNTLSLDGWTINGVKGDYQGVTSASFTRPANDPESFRDLLTVTTSYPLNPGWYTVGFYAFASKPSPISCYVFDPGIGYVTVNSQNFYSYYGDSANVFNLTKDNDFYWYSFYIPNVTHSKVKILIGRQNTDASKGATITVHRPFLVKGTPNRGYIHDSEQFMQKLKLSGRTLSLSQNGGSVTLPETGVSMDEYNKLKTAFIKVLQNLESSGAWSHTGADILSGGFVSNRNIATGNINIFGGTPDGNSFIRTNNGRTDNDLAGG